MKKKIALLALIPIILVLAASGCIGQIQKSDNNTQANQSTNQITAKASESDISKENSANNQLGNQQTTEPMEKTVEPVVSKELDAYPEIKNLPAVMAKPWSYNTSASVAEHFIPAELSSKPLGIMQAGNPNECAITISGESISSTPHLNLLLYPIESKPSIEQDVSRIPQEKLSMQALVKQDCYPAIFAEIRNFIIINSCANELTCGTGLMKTSLQNYFMDYK